MLRVLPFVLVFVLSVYCVVDVVTARDDRVRNFAKRWWLLLVLFVPLVGPIAWLLAGRPTGEPPPTTAGQHEAYLRQLKERAELQRFRYRQQQKRQGKDGPGGLEGS